MSSIGDNSSLLAAQLDLSLVQLLRQAIRAADLSGAAAAGTGHTVATSSPRQAAATTVGGRTGVRNCDRPAATFEPVTVHHCHPRLAELQPYTATNPVMPAACPPTIQAPWKVLPWPTAQRPTFPPGHRVIKIQAGQVDVTAVGRTLDLFV